MPAYILFYLFFNVVTCAGELPDVQIAYREILLPLQALHTDPLIAKQLLLSLFLV